MDDFNQIEVPPSFLALFTSPSGHKLTQPMSMVRERYELCEDLAQMLSDQALGALSAAGDDRGDVLGKMKAGLLAPGSPVQPEETTWVVTRLAELLGWELPSAEA